MAQDGAKVDKDEAKMDQDGPKMAKDVAKMVQDRAKMKPTSQRRVAQRVSVETRGDNTHKKIC